MSGGAGSSVHPSGKLEGSTPVGDPDVAGVEVEGAPSCTRSEKVVHAKTAAAANTANAITMAVTRRLAEGPEGAPEDLSTPDTFTTIATRLAHERFPWDLTPRSACPSQTGNRPGGGSSHLCVMRRGVSLVLGALLAGVVLLPATAQAKGSRLRFAEEAYAPSDRASRRPAGKGVQT